MKESGITKEVIRLSKEIAELWKMKIYGGCWIHFYQPSLPELVTKQGLEGNIYWGVYREESWFPIPDIADCLEKLRELGVGVALQDHLFLMYSVGTWDGKTNKYQAITDGSTPLEALLSAFLEVLKK